MSDARSGAVPPFRPDDAAAFIGSLLAHAPVGLGFLDRDLRYLTVNDALAAMNGSSSDAHIGRTIAEVIPALAPGLEPVLRRVLETGDAIMNLEVTDAPFTRERPRHWLCSYFPVRTPGDAIVGIGAFVLEVTDLQRSAEARRAAEHALADSELRQRGLLAAVPDLFFRLDARGRHLDFYAPSADRLYTPPDGIIGRTVSEVLPEAAASRYVEAIAAVLASGEALEFQYELTFPAGDTHVYAARMVPAAANEVLVLVRDVTTRRALESRLEQMQQQLLHAQKMDAIGRLAGGIAHDFNNLLTIISGSSHLLRPAVAADPEAVALLDEIRAAATTAAGLTQQLLAFGRRQQLNPEVVSVSAVVARAERLLRRTIRADIALEIELEAQVWQVRVDRTQLEQVLMNLAVNGRDAMPGGGRLLIATANVHSTGAEDIPPGDYVRLTVRDSGEGMDSEVRARLFEPFFTTKEQGKGTGLGLATVYGIVQQSGGYIRVDSAPGEGTTMQVYLPRVEEDLPLAEAAPSADAGALALPRGSGTVLLTEDNAAVRRLAASILRRCGYQVLEADSAAAALGLLEQPDRPNIKLLLTDLMMPGLSGRELAVRMRVLSPHTAVLFMSGYAGDVLGMREIGPEIATLEKPFTPLQLARAVKAAIDAAP